MLNIIYASPQHQMLGLLQRQPHFNFLCLVERREDLQAACDHFHPDVLLVSEQLGGDSRLTISTLLIQIKHHHPNLRIVYLAGRSVLNQPDFQKQLKQLAKKQIYNVHLSSDLSAPLLIRYIEEDFTVSHLEEQLGLKLSSPTFSFPLPQWTFSFKPFVDRWKTFDGFSKFQRPKAAHSIHEEIDFESASPSSDAFDLTKPLHRVSSNLRSREKMVWKFPSLNLPQINLPSIDGQTLKQGLKKYGPPAGLILTAGFCFYLSAKPILETKQGVNSSIDEWQALKEAQAEALIPTERPVVEDESEEFYQQKDQQKGTGTSQPSNSSSRPSNSSQTSSDPLLGLVQIRENGKFIGIRQGTSDQVLMKGAGLDELGVGLGEKGNTIIYGHREEVFWDLKNIKIGQLITLETLSGTLTYKVVNTRVTYPQDTSIYDASSTHKLTLVTCHPFVYMGPTPERFVVEAELVSNP